MHQDTIQADERYGAFVRLCDTDGKASTGAASYAVKDMADFPGHTASLGLASPPDSPAREAAPILQRLAAAGSRLVGFTKMTTLAFEPSGANPLQGRPLNPRDVSRICGGSSSGSAVAVAAGLVDVAIGSDTGGSLRIPAHCCGVTALKPTFGAIPVEGMMALAPSLDTIGFLGASAQAIMPFFDAARAADADGTDIGIVAIAKDIAATPAIEASLQRATAALSVHGVRLRDAAISPLIAACDEPVFTVLGGEAARVHRRFLERGLLDAGLTRRLEKGLAVSDADLAVARAALRRLVADWNAILDDADALLLPVMAIDTPLVAACEPGSPDFSGRTLYALSALTRFVNGLGLPAVALPCGRDGNGMPIGLQVVGRPGADRALLRLVARLQARGVDANSGDDRR